MDVHLFGKCMPKLHICLCLLTGSAIKDVWRLVSKTRVSVSCFAVKAAGSHSSQPGSRSRLSSKDLQGHGAKP